MSPQPAEIKERATHGAEETVGVRKNATMRPESAVERRGKAFGGAPEAIAEHVEDARWQGSMHAHAAAAQHQRLVAPHHHHHPREHPDGMQIVVITPH
eukprot:CAMPEP_0177559938 /NCGR_PEP_ID=MMETSP0369-20130122/71111_1 /TAXON_ID=447022 ORGANISM="Scrippsiella hangoei-like, Strain SHHI-4" /NCGR_SAMPLE_ID=MMETSP0369 /ASSEMBLY_ACC=CAM_ASM_000364 /LENGTH=97 /DNA_ID=CAMNT_0019046717 /DNA_START=290 /DNA_END=581 /DNA_ORIENTATION=-